MIEGTTIQSTAERIGAALLRARHLRAREMIMRGHWFPANERANDDAAAMIGSLQPGDRCGPDGAFVVVDPTRHQHLPELRELFEPNQQGDNARD